MFYNENWLHRLQHYSPLWHHINCQSQQNGYITPLTRQEMFGQQKARYSRDLLDLPSMSIVWHKGFTRVNAVHNN